MFHQEPRWRSDWLWTREDLSFIGSVEKFDVWRQVNDAVPCLRIVSDETRRTGWWTVYMYNATKGGWGELNPVDQDIVLDMKEREIVHRFAELFCPEYAQQTQYVRDICNEGNSVSSCSEGEDDPPSEKITVTC